MFIAVVNGGAKILKAVNCYRFQCTDYGCSCRPCRLRRVTVPYSVRALLGGRRECPKILMSSEVASRCFVILPEGSGVFPSGPEDEQLYLCFC